MEQDKSKKTIQAMFDSIAENYDFMNDVMTFCLHKKIKRNAVKQIKKGAKKIIDICTGTGDIAKITAEIFPDAEIMAIDFSHQMLSKAKEKNKNTNISFVEADAEELPFSDNYFDAGIIGFGLRNIQSAEKALKEFNRILKPSGELIIIDLFKHKNKWLYPLLLDKAVPLAAKAMTGNSKPYKYLIKSVEEYYDINEMSNILSANNFTVKKNTSCLFSTISTIVAEKTK